MPALRLLLDWYYLRSFWCFDFLAIRAREIISAHRSPSDSRYYTAILIRFDGLTLVERSPAFEVELIFLTLPDQLQL